MQRKIYLVIIVFFYCACHNKEENNIQKAPGNSIDEISLMLKADSVYQRKEYEMAIKYLNTIIGSDSTKGEYFFLRGKSYTHLLDRKNAILDYKNSISLHYRVSDACFNIGLNYIYQNDSMALLYFEKALPTNPYPDDVRREILECKRRLKQVH